MNQKTKSKVLDDVAQQYHPKEIDLSSRILSKAHREKVNTMKIKFALTAVTSIVCVIAVLFAIPTTAAAMKRIFGFIPGIGLINDTESFRVLKDPVKVERDGTTVSVLQGVIDSQNTTILYQVENLPDFQYSIESQISDVCHLLPKLILPDGSSLSGSSESGESWRSGYSRRIIFPALPDNFNTAQLVYSCFEQSMLSQVEQEWIIQLEFVQETGKVNVYPLIDLPTPDPSSSMSEPVEGTTANDIQLMVNSYTETDQALVIYGSLRSLSGNTNIESFEKSAIHLIDSTGSEIPLSDDPTGSSPADLLADNTSLPWSYLIESNYASGQATLTLDSAWIRANDIARFKLDLGDSPQPGQIFQIGQMVNIAGFDIVIENAEVNKDGNGLTFSIIKPEEISGIILMDFDHPLLGGGGYETYGFTYQDRLPSGEVNVTVVSALVKVIGPWETKFDLPTSTIPLVTIENSSVCFTQSSWQKALSELPALPQGLGGTLGINSVMPPDFLYRVLITNLEGTNQKILSLGNGVSLSPDGTQVIYNTDTGFMLMNLDTETVIPLSNLYENDGGVIWSPDSNRIAFTRGPSSGLKGGRGPSSIFIANPDGTEQIPVVEDGEANTVYAWHPDGQSLIYTVTGSEGANIRSINISTGKVTQLISSNYSNTTVALSPDGSQIVYQEMLPGDHYGIYLASMTNLSNPRLIVDGNPVVVTRPYWSPDGKWLIASVYDESISTELGTMTLINVDTCQIIPLLNLSGHVTSWIP